MEIKREFNKEINRDINRDNNRYINRSINREVNTGNIGRTKNNNSNCKIRRHRISPALKRRRTIIRFGLAVLVIITWIMVFLFAGKNVSQANDVDMQVVHTKYYKTITIKQNDTLWCIAEEHKTEEYDSIKDYVREIQLINGIEDDEINSGEKLIIPYYE